MDYQVSAGHSQLGWATVVPVLISSISHLVEEWAVSLVDPCPLGLPGSRDFDHRLDIHPWQLAPLDHLHPDLKAKRKQEQEEGGSSQAPRESEISGTILTAGFSGRVLKGIRKSIIRTVVFSVQSPLHL